MPIDNDVGCYYQLNGNAVYATFSVYNINNDRVALKSFPVFPGINAPQFNLNNIGGNGAYVISLHAYDMAGELLEEKTKVARLCCSSQQIPPAPALTFTQTPCALTSETSATIMAGSDLIGTQFAFKLDDNNWTSYTNSDKFTVSNLSDGMHVVYVSGKHPNQGYNQYPIVYNWIVNSSNATSCSIRPTPCQTYGGVSGVWSLSDSPIEVDCDLTIPTGQTLRIEPGVRVVFDGPYKLTVGGTLQASGIKDQMIAFTASNPTTGWKGIRFQPSSVDTNRLYYCVFEYANFSNRSNIEQEAGGAINANSIRALDIDHCIVQNNKGVYGAGINITQGSYSRIRNCIIRNNTASDDGGGIGILRASTLVENCLIINNTARDEGGSISGGGIRVSGACVPIIRNCTISNNMSSSSYGGGIGIFYYSNPIIVNSIIYNNTGGEIVARDHCNPTVTHSNIKGGYTGMGNTNLPPQFVNPSNGDYHLTNISPCLGRGTLTNYPATDMDGRIRPMPAGTNPDMGAYELAVLPSPLPVANVNGPYALNGDSGTINFSSADSYDPDGTIVSYLWNFGDGTTGTTANPSHAYNKLTLGTYMITLKVTDNSGNTTTAVTSLTVNPITQESEENNQPDKADGPVGSGKPVSGSIGTILDFDWFYFDLTGTGSITISLSINTTGQDLDWYLYTASNTTNYVARGYTTNNPETGSYNATTTGRYYVKVVGYNWAMSDYSLRVTSNGMAVAGIAGLDEKKENVVISQVLLLGQNYPNPFNPSTTIAFQLPQAGPVALKVFNIAGQLVKTLIDEEKGIGEHTVIWNGTNEVGADVPSGIYFYRLQAGEFSETKRMTLLK